MKVCMILPHFYPYVGGGEKLFYDLAKGLAARGHEVRVIAERVDEEHTGYKKIEGIEVWYCPWKSMFGHPFPKREDIEPHVQWCDIVHSSVFTTSPIGSRLARKYHKPSVLTIHEIRGNKWYWCDTFLRATIFYVYEWYTAFVKYDAYHVVSDSSKRDYEKFISKNRNVIRVYNANEMNPEVGKKSTLDLREYFDVSEDTNIFLYYGRPGQTKGIYVYLEAIKRLRDAGMDFTGHKFCFILGAEPADLRRKYIEDIHKYGLEDIMLIRSSLSRSDLAKAIEQADVVVVPSLTEGFGFSALEACQMGKRLISSNGCSLPEVVYGEVILFENRDDEDLARAIKAVIEKGEKAFSHIPEKTFTYEEMIEGILKIYYSLVQE